MKCKNHSNETAIEKCSECGSWFCDDCVTVVDNLPICNACLGKEANFSENIFANEPNISINREIIGEKRDFNPRASVVTDKLKEVGYSGIVEDANYVRGDNQQLSEAEIIHLNRLEKRQKINGRNEVGNIQKNTSSSKLVGKFAFGAILLSLHNPITAIIGVAFFATTAIDMVANRRNNKLNN